MIGHDTVWYGMFYVIGQFLYWTLLSLTTKTQYGHHRSLHRTNSKRGKGWVVSGIEGIYPPPDLFPFPPHRTSRDARKLSAEAEGRIDTDFENTKSLWFGVWVSGCGSVLYCMNCIYWREEVSFLEHDIVFMQKRMYVRGSFLFLFHSVPRWFKCSQWDTRQAS